MEDGGAANRMTNKKTVDRIMKTRKPTVYTHLLTPPQPMI